MTINTKEQVELANDEVKEDKAKKKLIKVYNVEVNYSNFCFIDKEIELHKNIYKLESEKKDIKKQENSKDIKQDLELKKKEIRVKKSELAVEQAQARKKNIVSEDKIMKLHLEDFNYKKSFYDKKSSINKIISIFDSTLTRYLELKADNNIHKEIIILQLDKDKIESLKYLTFKLVKYGFSLDNKQYIFFTASAGQMRDVKLVFIEKEAYEKNERKLLCGLEPSKIKMNVNKYLSYVALSESSTEVWQRFMNEDWIDKCIVVDDFETKVFDEIDYINKKYEIKRANVNGKEEMGVKIPHSDGCGMILPTFSDKNITIRLPWIKGLLVPVDWLTWIKEQKEFKSFKDIYGIEWTLDKLKENEIGIIFTKSQFKVFKCGFYKTWKEYQNLFKELGCEACICLEEESEDEFIEKRINYQMVQTLIDCSDKDMEKLLKKTIKDIDSLLNNKKLMIKKLSRKNESVKNLLEKYPNLLADDDLFNEVKKIKDNIVKKSKTGKFQITSKRTFIVPDVVAWMQNLFLGIKEPVGILKNGEVSCSLFKSDEIIDCLRSPQLDMAHCIRKNISSENTEKWFISNAIYTSSHDLITKSLCADCDGDQLLVVNDVDFVEIAKRHIEKYDIVPLHYEMGFAEEEEINKDTICIALERAWRANNIGQYSNMVTKIWNSWNIKDKDHNEMLDVIKLLTMECNKAIDSAKTGEEIKRPRIADIKISKYTKSTLLPYFFNYIHGEKGTFRDIKISHIDKIEDIFKNKYGYVKNPFIDNKNYKIKRNLLMNRAINSYNKINNKDIYDSYVELNKTYFERIEQDITFIDDIYEECRNEIIEKFKDKYTVNEIVDTLVIFLFETQYLSSNKKLFIYMFADILAQNIENNLPKNTAYCERCNKQFIKSGKMKYCSKDCK